MVDRTTSEGLNDFIAVVDKVEFTPRSAEDRQDQYKITMKTDVSKSGFMYEWVGITEKTTETSVPEGSNIDKYLQEVETVIPAAKKAETIEAALKMLEGKKLKFVRKKLGKSFTDPKTKITHDAKEFWVPQQLLE